MVICLMFDFILNRKSTYILCVVYKLYPVSGKLTVSSVLSYMVVQQAPKAQHQQADEGTQDISLPATRSAG